LKEEKIPQEKVSGKEAIIYPRLEEMKKRSEDISGIKNRKIEI
jgi:hypothetical protein